MPPGKPCPDQIPVTASAIRQKDLSGNPAQLILIDNNDFNILLENEVRGKLFGFGPVCLIPVGTVNPAKADTNGLFIEEDLNGVAINYTKDLTGEGCSQCGKADPEDDQNR